jgi:hypothetical protein
MTTTRTIWIHPATYTYRLEPPEQDYQSLWVERAGWGYLMRTDLWAQVESTIATLVNQGFAEMAPATDTEVSFCPHCRMYIHAVPGMLKEKHMAECGGAGEDNLAMEDRMISEIRREIHERRILQRIEQERQELEEAEKRERFDRIKEETAARQLSKDRKKRLKDETRELLRKR